jgi:hypothetical protein
MKVSEPDWLRVGTDSWWCTSAPQFNAAFVLNGVNGGALCPVPKVIKFERVACRAPSEPGSSVRECDPSLRSSTRVAVRNARPIPNFA